MTYTHKYFYSKLDYHLKDRNVEDDSICIIHKELSLYCKDIARNNTQLDEDSCKEYKVDSELLAFEVYDSILQSYEFKPVACDADVSKVLLIGENKTAFLFYKSDLEKEIERYGEIKWRSSEINCGGEDKKDKMHLCIYKITIPDIETRIRNFFNYFRNPYGLLDKDLTDLTDEQVDEIKKEFDRWRYEGYLIANYRIDDNQLKEKRRRKTFCRDKMYPLMKKYGCKCEIITSGVFIGHISLLFVFKITESVRSSWETAWNEAKLSKVK